MARRDATFEDTEEMLVEAWELLMRSPDRERGFLAAGSKSWWPEIVRDRVTDYADTEARPRLTLNRREVALRDRVFLDDACLAMEIAPANRGLVALVLAMRVRASQVDWSEVWTVLGGKRLGVTSNALRMRYERSVARIAAVEARRGEGRMSSAGD